jgi:hypothetical protein
MTKSTQSRRTPVAAAQQPKTNPRTVSKKLSATAVARKGRPAHPRKAGAQPTGKIATITALLRRPKGASIEDLVKATGWQAHSVRGAISGAIKKKLGLSVTSEKTGTVRLYRIADKSAG